MPDVDCTILWYVVVLLLIVSIIYFTFVYIILNIRSSFFSKSHVFGELYLYVMLNCQGRDQVIIVES